jgi:hypothetical protein
MAETTAGAPVEGPPRHDVTLGRIAWSEVRAAAPAARRCEADVVLTLIHPKVGEILAPIAESMGEGNLPGQIAALLKTVAGRGETSAAASELSAVRSSLYATLFNKKSVPWANQMAVVLSQRNERHEEWK